MIDRQTDTDGSLDLLLCRWRRIYSIDRHLIIARLPDLQKLGIVGAIRRNNKSSLSFDISAYNVMFPTIPSQSGGNDNNDRYNGDNDDPRQRNLYNATCIVSML